MVAVGQHYGLADDEDDGVFRVVGVPEDVTLLRVAGADGRRVHAGTIRHVPPDTLEAAFEPSANPDDGFSLRRSVRNALQGLYWEVRTLP